MKLPFVVAVACFLALAGCSRPAEEPIEVKEEAKVAQWQPVAPASMTNTQKAQQELVLSATNALVAEMMGELMAALDSGGPDAAIDVCQKTAPTVAANVSEQYGLRIGRTSHKLRNPENLPPAWAEPYVADRVDEPIYVAGPDGELGALLPIRLKAECQMCHGPTEMLDEEILTAIAQTYPTDQAVGFAEGDLRGWFWVETTPGDDDVEM